MLLPKEMERGRIFICTVHMRQLVSYEGKKEGMEPGSKNMGDRTCAELLPVPQVVIHVVISWISWIPMPHALILYMGHGSGVEEEAFL